MNEQELTRLGVFDSVLDVGGNLGDFAELARRVWPSARITSFEPIPAAAAENHRRANLRWSVEAVAISGRAGSAVLHLCTNQHTASTMQEPGTLRRERFGIVDRFQDVDVPTMPLDNYLEAGAVTGRLLVKIDVEGHELEVIRGAGSTLELAAAVVIEVQADPHIFEGAPSPAFVDVLMRERGLVFAGVLDAFKCPRGRVVQFDALYLRAGESARLA